MSATRTISAASRPPAGRRERQKAQTRQKIYEAAMELFAERGFLATTTEDITEAADVGQGTFFNYFPSKPHVLAALAEIQLQKIKAARREAETGQCAARELLQRLMHDLAQEPGRTPALTRSLFSALVSNDVVSETARKVMACGREELAAIMLLGQKKGEIERGRLAAEHAMCFQRSVLGTLFLWSMQEKGRLGSWLDATFADFWAGATAQEGRNR